MSTEENKVSKYSIVNRIYAFFQEGDAAQWTKFMDRIIKKLTREIEGLKKNISTHRFKSNQILDDIADKLEDAEQALEEAYLNIPVGSINTNAAQNAYLEVYLTAIEDRESYIKELEAYKEKEKEELKEYIAKCNEQIRVRKERIDKLTK